jgi:WD40 repeat protein
MMGVVDVKFNKQATKVAVSSLDSVIRVWDIDTSNHVGSCR